MKRHIVLLSALGVAGAVLSMSNVSLAAAAPPPQPTTVAPRTTERAVSYTGPNVPLITTGLGMFGLSYTPALIVGAMSSQSADRNLYIPVAGPWLDLANRPGCTGRACGSETTNKVLLGVDGVFQGVGAAMTVVGLLVPTRHEVVTKTSAKGDGPTLRISPSTVGTGYGLTAVGAW
jgi:hypothetical protein